LTEKDKEPFNFKTLSRSGRHVWSVRHFEGRQKPRGPSDDLDVEVYDLTTYKADRRFAPGASTKSAVFTPDVKYLITGDRTGTIMVWGMLTQVPKPLIGKQGHGAQSRRQPRFRCSWPARAQTAR